MPKVDATGHKSVVIMAHAAVVILLGRLVSLMQIGCVLTV
jgi:hypothetical protein